MNDLKRLRIVFLFSVTLLLGGITAVQATDQRDTTNQPLAAAPLAPAISDDFNSCGLASQWVYSDPVGDSTFTLNGTQMIFDLPERSRHDVWEDSNSAPRIMQPIDDTDFEIEVKFDTSVNSRFQLQGLIIEQDASNLLRFDFFHDGNNANIFYAKLENGAVVDSESAVVTDGAPMLMRIRREGDVFTQSYAIGNDIFQNHIAISYTGLNVTSVGIFAGNSGAVRNIPAFTSVVDYFFNTAAPIVPEDSDLNTITVNKVGEGTVSYQPVKSSYSCGEEIVFTATPALNHVFTGWSGSHNPSGTPYTWLVNGDWNATATFVEATDFLYLPTIFGFDQSQFPVP